MSILPQKFFERSTALVARELIGAVLVRRWHGQKLKARITEVEVYDGFRDKASHAARGRTRRNAPMFGPAGYWYVYFTYGMHWMLNIVTREKDYPAAILIRAGRLFPEQGRKQRNYHNADSNTILLNGPARLTKAFHIDGALNGKPAIRKNGLWIEYSSKNTVEQVRNIKKGPRIGVPYAGPYWAKRKLRFFLE